MCAYQVFHWLCVSYLFAGYYSVDTIVMSSLPSNVAAHATATSAPDPTVWFHCSRGENVSSLLGAWHHRTPSVCEIVDLFQVKISSLVGIAESVQVPTLRTSWALTPSTGWGTQKEAKPEVATDPKSEIPECSHRPPPIPRDPAGAPGLAAEEMDNQSQRELRGPKLPFPGTGTVVSAENRAIIETFTMVIKRTNAAPSRTADWGTMAAPMGPILVGSDTPPSLGGLSEPQVRENLIAAGPISPIVDQLDAENRRVGPLTPDPYGHLGPPGEGVALIQQVLSVSRQNPSMVELLPTPMSRLRRFPSLVEEPPSLGGYLNPRSGSRLNSTIIEASPMQMEEDECGRWFTLELEQGIDDEEKDIGVLEDRPRHHSHISVAPSPAPPEPMSRTRNHPMLVEESPAPHYTVVQDSAAPQYIVSEESPLPMSGVKDRRCLIVESPQPMEERAGATLPVPMSGTKDGPSLVGDSPAVLKVDNLCWGGENPVETGSATLPINLVSPPSTTWSRRQMTSMLFKWTNGD